MDQFRKFIPLAKIEEQADGTLHVYGIVTAQQPDHDGEVCDYDTSAPLFRAQASRMLKITSAVEGMEPSLMPMREMHQLKAIGAGRSMDFDDAAKTIRMGFNVVEPDAIAKFKKGVLIGFSQGGEYVKKWPDPEFKGKTRYTADPIEVSAVDSPCLPVALVESMKTRTFEMHKSNGSVEMMGFSIPEDLRMERVERMLEAIVKRDFNTEQRRHLAGTGAALPDGSFPIENAKDLENAIHDVGRASDPGRARAHIEARAHALGLTSSLPEGWGKKVEETAMEKMTDVEIVKAAKSAHEHLSGLKDMHKVFGEKMGTTHEGFMNHHNIGKCEKCTKAHESMMDHHEKMGDHIEKCMKAFEGYEPQQEAGEKQKSGEGADKALLAEVKKLADEFAEMKKKLAKEPEVLPAVSGAIQDAFLKSSGFVFDESANTNKGFIPPGMESTEVLEAMKKADLVTV